MDCTHFASLALEGTGFLGWAGGFVGEGAGIGMCLSLGSLLPAPRRLHRWFRNAHLSSVIGFGRINMYTPGAIPEADPCAGGFGYGAGRTPRKLSRKPVVKFPAGRARGSFGLHTFARRASHKHS